MRKTNKIVAAGVRVVICGSIGVIISLLVGKFITWTIAPLVGWDLAAIIYLIWVFLNVRDSDAKQTAALAVNEDTSRAVSETIVLFASIASIGAVGVLLFQSQTVQQSQVLWYIALGVFSVVISWTLVHTVYMIRYAHLYYKEDTGVDFNNSSKPSFSDFAYVAFTIGMTFQVSDTSFTTNRLRRSALKHALLSYLFGVVIIASTINLVAGLIK